MEAVISEGHSAGSERRRGHPWLQDHGGGVNSCGQLPVSRTLGGLCGVQGAGLQPGQRVMDEAEAACGRCPPVLTSPA